MRLNKRKHLHNTSVNPMRNSPMHNIVSYDAAYDLWKCSSKRDTELEIKRLKEETCNYSSIKNGKEQCS